jgi:hypothetical protein
MRVLNVMSTAEAGKLRSMTIIRHRRVGATQCRQDNDAQFGLGI